MAVVGAEDLLVDVGEFPFELTTGELANACRRAYLRIIVGANAGWGKAELARWLAGPYRRLTSDGTGTGTTADEAALGLKDSGAPNSFDLSRRMSVVVPHEGGGRDSLADITPIPSSVSVSEMRVRKLLWDMREDVLIVMSELMTADGRSAFTTLAADIGLVTRAQDESGADIAIPRVRERMSLVDRVLSLVAVDALTRSEDFEHSLFVCERCHQPVFDIHARSLGICRVHVSGVQTK